MACQNLLSRRHRATNLDRNFITVQSITTIKYMLLPLQKRPGKCGAVRVKTDSSLIYLLDFHVNLIKNAKRLQQMGTVVTYLGVTSPELICFLDHLRLADWHQSRWSAAQIYSSNSKFNKCWLIVLLHSFPIHRWKKSWKKKCYCLRAVWNCTCLLARD